MSDAFEKREEGFEKRFAHDEETRFRALARRNKALGLWAAEQIGVSGEAAQSYATRFVADLVGKDEDAVASALRKAFDKASLEMSDNRLRRKMAAALEEATAQVKNGR